MKSIGSRRHGASIFGRTSLTIIGRAMTWKCCGSSSTLKIIRCRPVFARVRRIGRGRRPDFERIGQQGKCLGVGQAFQPDGDSVDG